MNKIRNPLLVLLLLVILLAPRLVQLNSFVTLDEPFWLSVGGNFYYAFGQRELEKTVYEYHPAVTTMWIVTGAFLADFPEYRGFGQGYFDVDKNFFDPFLLNHDISPLHLLYVARLIQIAVIVFFALLIFYLLSGLLNEEWAFFITAFTSSAPYFLGHSRVLSHESMVAFFVLVSIFSMMVYLGYGRKWYFLLISAVSAALAQLTKSSAMALFPVIVLMFAVSVFENMKKDGFRQSALLHLKAFGFWLMQLIVAYVFFWPGMWVAPGKMLYEVYGNAFSYAFQGARLQVTQELDPSKFQLNSPVGMMKSFIGNLISYATPVSWIGMLLAVLFLVRGGRESIFPVFNKLVVYLTANAFMFIILFSVAQGRNSPHYIMTSYVSMDAVAALGWVGLLGWIGAKLKTIPKYVMTYGLGVGLIIMQLFAALSSYPYYYTYSNPILNTITGTTPLFDYGEGFALAGAYLAQKPNAKDITVLAVHGRGALSYFFPGETIILNLLYLNEPGMPSLLERMARSDYLVINDAVQSRSDRSALFVEALESTEPEYVIQIKHIQTIRIYRIADLPPAFYEAISK